VKHLTEVRQKYITPKIGLMRIKGGVRLVILRKKKRGKWNKLK
jgi:hypothetical protein